MKTKIITKATKPIIHFLLILFSFWFCYQLRFYLPGTPLIDRSELTHFAIVSAIIWIIVGYIYSVFNLTNLVFGYYSKFIRAIFIRFVIITFLAYFGNGFIYISGISRFILISAGSLTWFLLSISDSFGTFLYKNIFTQPEKILIISNIDTNTSGYITDISNNLQNFGHYDINTDIYSTVEYIYHIRDYDIIVLVGDIPKDELQDLADKANIAGKLFVHIPEGLLLEDMLFRPQRFGSILGLVYQSSNIQDRARVIKRLIDIFGSTIAIIILSPIMIIIYIFVVLSDGFPGFFVQSRVGKNGKEFKFIKFRTMKREFCTGTKYGGNKAEEYYQHLIQTQNIRPGSILPKIGDDPRVTWIGKFLRKTSLDELPSLFCVLVGNMSLVGPRPHLPNEVEHYNIRQKKLLSVKPGITGYAQIWGRDKIDFNDEANFDLHYLRNRSIRFDLYILLATMKVVTKGQ